MCGVVLMVNLGKTSNAEKKQEKEKALKADDPKAGADVGKILWLRMPISSVIFFLCPDTSSRNRIIRSHKSFQDFISSTKVLYSLPSPMPAY
jgi:hypothetical protein